MPKTTNTLQQTVNFAATHAKLLPLTNVGGLTNEPSLSICNDVLSELCAQGNDWKFNRQFSTILVTSANKQDYLFAGASAFTLNATGLASSSASSGACIDLTTNNAITVTAGVVMVKTLENHRFKVGDTVNMVGNSNSAYNSVYTDDGTQSGWSNNWLITAVTSNSFSFAATTGQNNGDVTGAAGINDFGWLSSATMVEMNNNSSPQNSVVISAVKTLQPWSKVANPEKVSVEQDYGTGVIRVRFQYVPGTTIWGVQLVYQAAAPVKIDLSATWSPFPDSLSFVYRQGLIALMYRYINDARSEVEYQKFMAAIAKAQAFDDNEESEVFMTPEDGSIFDGLYWGM